MTRELFLAAAAVALIVAPAAFAQSAGVAPSGPALAGGAATSAPTPAAPEAPSTLPATGAGGLTQPGVAGGVTPYRPAGAPASNTAAGDLGPSAGGASALPGPTSGPSLAGSINTTLQAGQIAGSDSATVGGASASPGLRTPNLSTGVYNGQAGPSYGAPGATPYTGAGAASVPAGAAPYTGPGVVSGSAGGAPGSAASPTTEPTGGASGR